jgi:hypothetical protein
LSFVSRHASRCPCALRSDRPKRRTVALRASVGSTEASTSLAARFGRIDRSHSLRWASPRSECVYVCSGRTIESAVTWGCWFMSACDPEAKTQGGAAWVLASARSHWPRSAVAPPLGPGPHWLPWEPPPWPRSFARILREAPEGRRTSGADPHHRIVSIPGQPPSSAAVVPARREGGTLSGRCQGVDTMIPPRDPQKRSP